MVRSSVSVPCVALVQDSVFASEPRPVPAASLVAADRIDDDRVSDLALALFADAVLVDQAFVLAQTEYGAWCADGFAGEIPAPIDGSVLPDPGQHPFIVQGARSHGGVLVFRMTDRGPVRFAAVPELACPSVPGPAFEDGVSAAVPSYPLSMDMDAAAAAAAESLSRAEAAAAVAGLPAGSFLLQPSPWETPAALVRSLVSGLSSCNGSLAILEIRVSAALQVVSSFQSLGVLAAPVVFELRSEIRSAAAAAAAGLVDDLGFSAGVR